MNPTVDQEKLTCITGDAFADTGGRVIAILQQHPQLKGYDILKLIEFVADVYVNNWEAKLHPFFLNSGITQPAYKGQRKIDETVKYYASLIDETAPHKEGICQISGVKGKVFLAGRHNTLLSGSGTFVNFHTNLQEGAFLSKEMLLRMIFIPFGVMRLAARLVIIISNEPVISDLFVRRNCEINLAAVSANTSKGVIKSEFNNPANALFRFTDECVDMIQDMLPGHEVMLHMHHFSNMGQSPEMTYYKMDNKVFDFYTWCTRGPYQEQWKKFVRAHYKSDGKSAFNYETGEWERKGEEIDFEEYSKWRNFVLNNLLYGRSILKFFLNWTEYNDLDFEVVQTYQTDLMNMKKETVQKVKVLATYVVNAYDDDQLKKLLTSFNAASHNKEFRQLLFKVQKKAFEDVEQELPLTVEDWTEHFFPPNPTPGHWNQLRDLLVIATYQEVRNLKTNNNEKKHSTGVLPN